MGWNRTLLAALLPLASAAGLVQKASNGNSVLGTPLAPELPPFLTNNPLPQGFPWGSLTANGTNQYTTYPNTGVIRSYDFTISRGTLAPDGYEKSMILINGAFPGPTIEANWGDTIQVTVHNNITGPEEGTAMHWHGFLQQGTPWEDGVPAITQCPIAPGSSFTYQFQATLYGTAWYHSHYSAQYGDGILGAMVVYGPNEYPYDIDVGPILLSDYYHKDYLSLLEMMLAPGGKPEIPSDNNLIQGKGNFDCATAEDKSVPCSNDASLASFTFEAGKTHRLRLINSGAEGIQHFSIDGHTLTVIAYDFIPIEAYDTKVITLGVGQRADILVKADAVLGAVATNASFWMRSNIATCSTAKQPYAKAAIYYVQPKASNSNSNTKTSIVTPVPGVSTVATAANVRFGVGGGWGGAGGYGAGSGSGSGSGNAGYHGTPSSSSSSTRHGGGTVWGPSGSYTSPSSSSGSSDSSPNTQTPPNLNRPLPTTTPWTLGINALDPSICSNDDLHLTHPLYPIALPQPSWTHEFEISTFVNASNVTLWKFDGVSFRGDYNAPTLLLASLGNTTWPTVWNGRNLYSNSSVRMIVNNNSPSQHPMHLHGANFYVLHEGPGRWDGKTIINPSNPMRRDVQLVRPGGHLVLQFDATNAGVWPFHCHIAWHASGGFLEQFIVQPHKIEQMQVPSIMAQTCRDWAAWTGTHVPDQIDSGL
ncbi:multicopper oxidase [Ophiostoma piceae UAMH 11346]|uniref:Multicopper oxidase n=1 Tax=Ophiostoma piceae (strain UAMH 11346) TaxID=1262450 RepID=S3CPA3_OPHP1|nr:multicopper oxidase [Ophiostoma piceae UAMH 11346]